VEAPLVLLSGFGTFEGVEHNPSGAVARALDGADGVVGVELPVTFRGCTTAWEVALEGLRPRRPAILLATGVHPGATFRLERRARAALSSQRPDNDGECWSPALQASDRGEAELVTGLDLERLARALAERDLAAPVVVSDDAGGYVCERIYRHVLERAAELDCPGLFLHLPPLDTVEVQGQVAAVGALLEALRGELGDRG